jgi:MFS family permease
MFSWFRDLDGRERRTFWACFNGWALDAMDAQLYALSIPALIAAWSISKGEAGVLSTVALVTSAFGGWIAGIFSDRYGRVQVLQFTILWFSVFTCLSGLTQSFNQLLIVRSLQGFGFGGEWAAGAVLMGEIIQARHRGKAVGLVQAGLAVGYGVAVIIVTTSYSLLPKEYAWRVPFFFGLLPALLVFYVRRFVEEPEVFLATRRRIAPGEKPARASEIFAPDMLARTCLATLLIFGILGGSYIALTWLPTFLFQARGLKVSATGLFLMVTVTGQFCGYVGSSHLSDLWGRRKTFIIFALCASMVAVIYTQADLGDAALLAMGWPLGFFQSGVLAGTGAFLTELFPTRIRGTAQGFSYNAGRGLAALFPALVGYYSDQYSLGVVFGVFIVVAYALVVVAALLLPETQGKELLVYE